MRLDAKPAWSWKPRDDALRFEVNSAPSTIHGTGAFAAGPIPARAKIGELTGKVIPVRTARRRALTAERIYLVDLDERTALDCSQGNVLRYLNHSCRSNAFLRIARGRVEVFALRAIRPAEELTVNYGETPHPGGMVCRCGRPDCRGRL
jgi:SET domain-containing protein